MSTSLLIAVNVVADLGILGLLTFVMSRASLLKPHASAHVARAEMPLRLAHVRHRPAQTPRRSTAALSARS